MKCKNSRILSKFCSAFARQACFGETSTDFFFSRLHGTHFKFRKRWQRNYSQLVAIQKYKISDMLQAIKFTTWASCLKIYFRRRSRKDLVRDEPLSSCVGKACTDSTIHCRSRIVSGESPNVSISLPSAFQYRRELKRQGHSFLLSRRVTGKLVPKVIWYLVYDKLDKCPGSADLLMACVADNTYFLITGA